jgi:tetratricopeptide (TPR) repeat protein
MDSLMQIWSDASQPTDQRLSAFDALFGQFYEQHPNILIPELDKLKELAKSEERPLILYEAYVRKAIVLNYQGKNREALPIYDEAEEVAQSIGDSLRMGTIAANRGNVYAGLGDYLSATQQFTLALERYTAAEYAKGQQSVRMALGNVFVLIDNYALGKSYYEEVLESMGEETSDRFRGLLSLNLGWCEYKLGNFERAIEWYTAAQVLLEKEQAGFYLTGLYANQASLYFDQGRLEESRTSAQKGLELSQTLGATRDEFQFQLKLAKIELEFNAQEALQRAKAIEKDLTPAQGYEATRDFYELMYGAHKALGHIAEALTMHELYLAYRDSIQEQKNHNLVLRTAYEKEVEHQLLTLEMKGNQEQNELRIKQLQTVIWLILSFIMVVGSLVFYIANTQKKNRLRRTELLGQIDELRASRGANLMVNASQSALNRTAIETFLGRALNETDWKVLTILSENPSITNAKIAEAAFLSIDGIGSSLRRMYEYFDIRETKYKKIALLHAAMQLSV